MQAFTLKNSQMTPGLHIHVVVFNWYNAVSLIEVKFSSEIQNCL